MAEQPSNETLFVIVNNVDKKLDNLNSLVVKFHDELRETNSRVVKIEEWREIVNTDMNDFYDVVKWQSLIKGGLVVVSVILTGIVIPLAVNFLKK